MSTKSTWQPTLYELLGASESASSEEIRSAWRKAATKYHPDKGGSDETFRTLSAAYDVLGDPVKRVVYDRQLAAERPTARRPEDSNRAQSPGPSSSGRSRESDGSSPRDERRSGAGVRRGRSSSEPVTPVRAGVGASIWSYLHEHALVAAGLVVLGWVSVWLRAKGLVTVFEPHANLGHAYGGLPDVPSHSVASLFEYWIVGLVGAGAFATALWRALGWRSRVIAALGVEVLLLSVNGLARGKSLAVNVDLWVGALLTLIYLRAKGVAAVKRRIRSLVGLRNP